MSRQRRLNWTIPERAPPKNPVRDTLLVYGVLALVVVGLAWVTGGSVSRAIVIAALFYVIATSWNLYRWRERAREQAARSRGDGSDSQ
jgi:membrane protein implicated in regulation of membrane protease activity